jgi:glycosyltransferase involved in cell wall biosynthesis
MENHPLVSVIISTCNRIDYLKKAIESILGQTYKNIELIIVDNGSNDGTLELARQLSQKDNRIKVKDNKSSPFSRGGASNKGIELANGKYIARLDDDDYWADEKKLEKQVDFLENNQDYVLVGGGMIGIDKSRKEMFRCLFPERDEDIRKIIIFDNFFSHGTVVFRRDACEKAGGYQEHSQEPAFPEDWDLWLKLGKIGKFYNFQEYFLYYLRAGQNTFKPDFKKTLKINNQIRKKYKKDYPGFQKAYLISYLGYLYSFLPFKKGLRSIFFKLSTGSSGSSSYRYYEK